MNTQLHVTELDVKARRWRRAELWKTDQMVNDQEVN